MGAQLRPVNMKVWADIVKTNLLVVLAVTITSCQGIFRSLWSLRARYHIENRAKPNQTELYVVFGH